MVSSGAPVTSFKIGDEVEVWWIFSRGENEWNGLRVAFFRKVPPDEMEIVVIIGELDPRRVGPRVWADMSPREGWVKVRKIDLPTGWEIVSAIDAAIYDIVQKIKDEFYGGKEP